MVSAQRFDNLLFFDIETAGQYKDYEDFQNQDPLGVGIWQKKWEMYLQKEDLTLPDSYVAKAAIYPEFGRIVCLSYGVYRDGVMTVKTISHEREADMMPLIYQLFVKASERDMIPIGWNVKQFDIPWINRKLLVHGFNIPSILDTFEKKPWELKVLDLREMWKNGSAHPCSFEEAAYAMDIPTPKDDICGSQVHVEYWKGHLERITKYCEKDVSTMIELLKKMSKL